jgi:glycogen operon protein
VATRLTGSSDLYQYNGRRPWASINFVTSHDGFTLSDLVTYHEKRNLANLEDNRDGESHNNNWNCGAEGETDNPEVNQLRLRQRKNMMATLLLSQGVPMIRGGDELSHSQKGNNNAYCQDNEISWLNWELNPEEQRFLEFCQQLTSLWHEQPVLKRRNFFHGRRIRGVGVKDIAWLSPQGGEITDHEWRTGAVPALGMRLNGESIDEVDERGQRITGESLVILWNARPESASFVLPRHKPTERWRLLFDTSLTNESPPDSDTDGWFAQDERYPLQGRSVVVFVLKVDTIPDRPQFHTPHGPPPIQTHLPPRGSGPAKNS